MKVMVTGSRAPVALDLMRALHSQGHQVYSADSMRFPACRFSKSVHQHSVLPSPNANPQGYYQALKQAIQQHQIDYLIPTCEEIFFISRFHKELSMYCKLFLDPLEKLSILHDKYQFAQFCRKCLIKVPQSYLVSTNQDKETLPTIDLVLKPVFSRFASHALIKPGKQQIQALDVRVPYVAQEFISGTEYCVYAIAHEGTLLAHAAYQPKYTAGAGAGIYFEPINLKEIELFITHLVQKIQFTGQISFDFIQAADGLYVLECNPRATSGLHLLAQHVNWQEILNGHGQTVPKADKPKMLKFAMLSYGISNFFSPHRKEFMQDYQRAIDVLNISWDKWMHLKSLPAFVEILLKSIRFNKSFKEATTHDIEWNGESF
ncbi:MAG: ATP-grasp domain-containing protein [Legionella sp.]|uniref:ATP-grasp domain-containing protein n=1 Tax=Legionella sp. TaxID=459 RepID=UPI0028401D66|nr:ATP-grasp domain-containing protein [Legionella sp.]